MAAKKKAYERFGELTQRAVAPTPVEPEAPAVAPSATEEITILLHPEVARALEENALERNITPSEVVEEALRRLFNIRRWG